ncbi:MAG TPA: hypothetical protein VGC42_05865, partial [Kofleriaceae bacterium]
LRAAEARLAEAEQRAQRASAVEQRMADAEARVADAEHRLAEAQAHGEALQTQLAEQQRRVQAAQDVSGRATTESERRIAAAEQRAEAAEGNAAAFARQTSDMQTRIAALEREVATADNVRSFAAETEREIAGLQRELREAKAKLAQITLERDRLESEVRDNRVDTDTTHRRAAKPPAGDHDSTAQVNLSKYESVIAGLRNQLSESQRQLREAIDGDDDSEMTRTGAQVPISDLAAHVTQLEESINSLRANMRAASDETAMMSPSESVSTISSAVSEAAEHVEVARAAVKALAASIGIS